MSRPREVMAETEYGSTGSINAAIVRISAAMRTTAGSRRTTEARNAGRLSQRTVVEARKRRCARQRTSASTTSAMAP